MIIDSVMLTPYETCCRLFLCNFDAGTFVAHGCRSYNMLCKGSLNGDPSRFLLNNLLQLHQTWLHGIKLHNISFQPK